MTPPHLWPPHLLPWVSIREKKTRTYSSACNYVKVEWWGSNFVTGLICFVNVKPKCDIPCLLF
jgi:hypothetical protein